MVTEQEAGEEKPEKPTFNIQPGDLGGLMAEYPHIREWIEDFEAALEAKNIYVAEEMINSFRESLDSFETFSYQRINQEKMETILSNVNTTIQNGNLSDCDIIIEAIIENVNVKKKKQ